MHDGALLVEEPAAPHEARAARLEHAARLVDEGELMLRPKTCTKPLM
jgi:hypothetical protein